MVVGMRIDVERAGRTVYWDGFVMRRRPLAKFGAAATAFNGLVVFAPLNAEGVGVFDAATSAFSFFDVSATLNGTIPFKFGGAAAVPGTGQVVFAPSYASGVGVYDAIQSRFAFVDISASVSDAGAGMLFGGAATVPSSGVVVFAPVTADGIGYFDPATSRFALVSVPQSQLDSIGGRDTADFLKFGGAIAAPNGQVVLIPSYGSAVGALWPVAPRAFPAAEVGLPGLPPAYLAVTADGATLVALLDDTMPNVWRSGRLVTYDLLSTPGTPVQRGSLGGFAGAAGVLTSTAGAPATQYAYVLQAGLDAAGYGLGRLSVVSLADPSAPTVVGYVRHEPSWSDQPVHAMALGSGGRLYVTSGEEEELALVDVSVPASPRVVSVRAAWSKSPPWQLHSWPPRAPQTASEG